MIKEVSGDILLTSAQVIVHGVAPGDHFDKGLALALREQWPSLAKDFRHHCHTSHPKAGDVWMWGTSNGKRVVSLLTQDEVEGERAAGKAGRAHLEHVNHALRALRLLTEKEKFTSLAVPRLATGIGGLSWDEVYPMIKHVLSELTIPIYVYAEYRKGQAATESPD